MRKLILVSFLILTGCDKLMPIPMWNTGEKTTHPTRPIVVLVWGDSQGWRWGQEGGITALYTKFPQIHLIDCAVPGSRIGQWTPDLIYWQTCKQQLNGQKLDIVIGFIGTNDTGSLYGEPYHLLLMQMIDSWAGLNCSPKQFLIEVGDNNSTNSYPYWGYVQQEQQVVNGYRNTVVVPTFGLATEPLPDGIHWTSDSMKDIGARIAGDL